MPGRSFLPILLASFLLQACLFGGNGDGGGGGSDYRKPPAPEVEYRTFDSLVYIDIEGRRSGEASQYWIYRDKMLLEEPSAIDADSLTGTARFRYRLVDSVPKEGTYVYRVFYGPRKDSLSESSEPYTFAYQGPSPSGRIFPTLLSAEDGIVRLSYLKRSDALLRQAVIERRVGGDDEESTVDTLFPGTQEWWGVLDTAGEGSGWYFYRVKAQGADDEWLEASPWDSVEVRERPWTYLPVLNARDQGSEVRLWVANPLGTSGIAYTLYRNSSGSRDGAESLDTAGQGLDGVLFSDIPEQGKTWHYWVVARDARGRTSPRSTPVKVEFTGVPAGPSITALSASSSSVQIAFEDAPGAVEYVLERRRGGSGDATALDTLADQPSSGFPSHAFSDRPPSDGDWSYRIVAVYSDGEQSRPGEWAVLRDWHYQPFVQSLPAQVVNRGDRVEISLASAPSGWTLVLFRSARSTGQDSVAVDTVVSPLSSFATVVLGDSPAAGTWYYRIYGTGKDFSTGSNLLRSELLRVEFTGKPAGPAVASAMPSGRHVAVAFPADAEAVAYILERAPGEGGEWKAVDTVAAAQNGQGTVTVRNMPPSAGHWRYRVRSVRTGLVVTEPGAPMRTSSPWTDAVTYENNLSVQVTNNGSQVEIQGLSTSSEVEHRIYRSAKPDWNEGALLATLTGFQTGRHVDTPASGTWYYWVERSYIGPFNSSSVVSRSVPARVVFTGAPDVISLSGTSQGITVAYPGVQSGDTLEILRSTASPDKEEDFKVVHEATSSWSTSYQDPVGSGNPGFYHYRLRLKRDGKASPLGGVKSIYYEYPSQSGGFPF